MRIRRLTSDDVHQFVEDLWLPFAREMESNGEWNELATDVDLHAQAVAYRRDRLTDGDARTWIAVDPDGARADDSADAFAGYASASYRESPPVFARGNRIHVDELFVHEAYRGTDLASDLLDLAHDWAVELGCEELTLSVGEPNDRAQAFYEREGFTIRRRRMARPVEKPERSAERL
ncbi:MAG: GNAT family N-acetyltransferase [Halopenitus sp.]